MTNSIIIIISILIGWNIFKTIFLALIPPDKAKFIKEYDKMVLNRIPITAIVKAIVETINELKKKK